MPPGVRTDPYLDFRFVVEIESLVVGGFNEVEGLEIEIETEEYEEGGVNDHTRVFPSRTSHGNITLRRGLTDADELWGWVRNAQYGRAERKSGRILILNSTGVPTFGWEFSDAFPVRWDGPDFAAEGGDVAVETLELAHEGITRYGGIG